MKTNFASCILILVLAVTAPFALAAPPETVLRVGAEPARAPLQAAPAGWRAASYPENRKSRLFLQELPARRILDVHNHNQRNTLKPTQVGIARSVDTDGVQKALPGLHWVSLRSGGSVARFEVSSPDALGLRIGLQLGRVDPRVELRFAGSNNPLQVVAVVKAAEALRLKDSRQIYWTPATDGEAQIVEVHAPAGVVVGPVALRVIEVSHLLTNSKNDFQLVKSIGSSGTCNVDTVCRVNALPQGYVDVKNSVARMLFVVSGSSYTCTGTLLNDNKPDGQVPYFYSAHHCISDATVANTLNTYWGFEATSCGSNVAAANTLLAGGAAYLYSDANTDALFLRLNNPPPAGAAFSGWDATTLAQSAQVLAIHHPASDLKKSSLGQQLGSDSHHTTVGWTDGTTEGGSSGSGLFTITGTDYFLRGGLYGGSASCANSGSLSTPGNRDYYSRFDVVFPSISQYLSHPTANVAPVADFSATTSGLTATFTDLSIDGDGTIASRSWNLGDGLASNAINPVHSYATSGTYEVQLSVADNRGGSHSIKRNVTVDVPSLVLRNGDVIITKPSSTAELRYQVNVPAGATALTFTTTGGAGDLDLFVSYGVAPTTEVHNCASERPGNEEVCSFSIPQVGTYHVLLSTRSTYSAVMFVGSYVEQRKLPQHDFNGDGKSDVLWRNIGTGANTIWKSANNSITQPMATVVDLGWSIVGVGDFDGDGNSDILWRHGSTGSNTIWRSGNSATAQALTRITNLSWKVVGIGDFDGDGKSDIFWRHAGSGANGIWRSGNYSTQQATMGVSNLAWRVVGVGDFDGDGRSDVLWRNHVNGANTIWKSGNSSTIQSTSGVTSQAWKVSGVGDFNGDGKSDILWRNTSTGANTIWRSGQKSSILATATVTSQTWKIVAVADFDGDAHSDILWRNSSTGANVIWRYGNKLIPQLVQGVTSPSWTVMP